MKQPFCNPQNLKITRNKKILKCLQKMKFIFLMMKKICINEHRVFLLNCENKSKHKTRLKTNSV